MGITTKLHFVVKEDGVPVQFSITDGVTADCKEGINLIQKLENVNEVTLIADKAYDSNEVIAAIESKGMKDCIPPRKNRKIQREYDNELYKTRRLVENAFLKLKRFRWLSTRYCKTVDR